MGNVVLKTAYVYTVDDDKTCGLRIKYVPTNNDITKKDLISDWCFPLLPKTFQIVPKVGECVLIVQSEASQDTSDKSQEFYIGPIISQPQFMENCGFIQAKSLLDAKQSEPLASINNDKESTDGSYPKLEDVAVVGRGCEDIILRYDDSKTSEIDIRAGIKGKATDSNNKDIVGNVVFNSDDPAYIQLKRKNGLVTGEKKQANSVVNVVADRINIMSNKDDNVNANIHNSEQLVEENEMNKIMDDLHQVPMGDKLVELLKIMKGAIMHHVHPWAGMEQCGDWPGYIKKLEGYDIDSILSEYVRIS